MFVPSGDAQVIIKGEREVGDLLYKETGLHYKTLVATSYAALIEAWGQVKSILAGWRLLVMSWPKINMMLNCYSWCSGLAVPFTGGRSWCALTAAFNP